MQILVDSSVWVDFFRGGPKTSRLRLFIKENIVVTNDLILAELIPPLKIRKQSKLISLMKALARLELKIDWDQIIDYQHRCLKKGINGVGIPDLIIAQNAVQNDCEIYSFDQHFKLMKNAIRIRTLP